MMKKSRILAGLSAAAIAASMMAVIPASAATFKGNAGVEFQTNKTYNFRNWFGDKVDDAGTATFPDYHVGVSGAQAFGVAENVTDNSIDGPGDYTVAISANGRITEKGDDAFWYPISGNENVTMEDAPWSMAGNYSPVFPDDVAEETYTNNLITGWTMSSKSDKFNMLGVTTDIPVYYEEDDDEVVHCYLDSSMQQEVTVSDLVVKIGGTEYKADEAFFRDDLDTFGISVINTWGNSSIDPDIAPPETGMVEISFHIDVTDPKLDGSSAADYSWSDYASDSSSQSGSASGSSSSESATSSTTSSSEAPTPVSDSSETDSNVGDDTSVDDTSSEEEPAVESFTSIIPDSEIVETDIVGDEGWSEFTVPYSYVDGFPEGAAAKITVDYTKRKRYITTKEQIVKPGHDVKKANIAFIIDTTGSMSDDIASVRANLTDFVNTLKEKNIEVSFAIIDYQDDDIIFHDIDGAKWSNNTEAVLEVLDETTKSCYGGDEYAIKAYDKLFEETPDWYTTSDTNFIFLLTDEDIDLKGDEAESYDELVTRLTDLGISNTVVTETGLNEFYKDLYEKTSGTVFDIHSTDYGKLMSEFASHVEDIVTHTVVYEDWKVTAIDGAGSVVIKGADSDDYAVDVDGDETGTISFVIPAEEAAKLFVEDPNNPGMSLLKIKDFGLDLTQVTIEAIKDVPDNSSSEISVPSITERGASLIQKQRRTKYEYRPMFETPSDSSSSSSAPANPAVPGGGSVVAPTGGDDNSGTGAGVGLGITGLLLAAAAVVVVKKRQ